MKNICVVTATRSEYGLLRWIIDILSKDKDVNLQIVATGSHLSKEFGMTYHFILKTFILSHVLWGFVLKR